MTIVRLTIHDLRFSMDGRLAISNVATVQNSQSLKANSLAKGKWQMATAISSGGC